MALIDSRADEHALTPWMLTQARSTGGGRAGGSTDNKTKL